MAVVRKSLFDGVLTATLTDSVYTTPALTRAGISSCVVCNVTAGAVALVVKVLTATSGTLRTVITRNVAVGYTDLCPELVNLWLNVGGKVEFSGLNMEVVLSGVEVTS